MLEMFEKGLDFLPILADRANRMNLLSRRSRVRRRVSQRISWKIVFKISAIPPRGGSWSEGNLLMRKSVLSPLTQESLITNYQYNVKFSDIVGGGVVVAKTSGISIWKKCKVNICVVSRASIVPNTENFLLLFEGVGKVENLKFTSNNHRFSIHIVFALSAYYNHQHCHRARLHEKAIKGLRQKRATVKKNTRHATQPLFIINSTQENEMRKRIQPDGTSLRRRFNGEI